MERNTDFKSLGKDIFTLLWIQFGCLSQTDLAAQREANIKSSILRSVVRAVNLNQILSRKIFSKLFEAEIFRLESLLDSEKNLFDFITVVIESVFEKARKRKSFDVFTKFVLSFTIPTEMVLFLHSISLQTYIESIPSFWNEFFTAQLSEEFDENGGLKMLQQKCDRMSNVDPHLNNFISKICVPYIREDLYEKYIEFVTICSQSVSDLKVSKDLTATNKKASKYKHYCAYDWEYHPKFGLFPNEFNIAEEIFQNSAKYGTFLRNLLTSHDRRVQRHIQMKKKMLVCPSASFEQPVEHPRTAIRSLNLKKTWLLRFTTSLKPALLDGTEALVGKNSNCSPETHSVCDVTTKVSRHVNFLLPEQSSIELLDNYGKSSQFAPNISKEESKTMKNILKNNAREKIKLKSRTTPVPRKSRLVAKFSLKPEGEISISKDTLEAKEGKVLAKGGLERNEGKLLVEDILVAKEGILLIEENVSLKEGTLLPEYNMVPNEGKLIPEDNLVPNEGKLIPEDNLVPNEGKLLSEDNLITTGRKVPANLDGLAGTIANNLKPKKGKLASKRRLELEKVKGSAKGKLEHNKEKLQVIDILGSKEEKESKDNDPHTGERSRNKENNPALKGRIIQNKDVFTFDYRNGEFVVITDDSLASNNADETDVIVKTNGDKEMKSQCEKGSPKSEQVTGSERDAHPPKEGTLPDDPVSEKEVLSSEYNKVDYRKVARVATLMEKHLVYIALYGKLRCIRYQIALLRGVSDPERGFRSKSLNRTQTREVYLKRGVYRTSSLDRTLMKDESSTAFHSLGPEKWDSTFSSGGLWFWALVGEKLPVRILALDTEAPCHYYHPQNGMFLDRFAEDIFLMSCKLFKAPREFFQATDNKPNCYEPSNFLEVILTSVVFNQLLERKDLYDYHLQHKDWIIQCLSSSDTAILPMIHTMYSAVLNLITILGKYQSDYVFDLVLLSLAVSVEFILFLAFSGLETLTEYLPVCWKVFFSCELVQEFDLQGGMQALYEFCISFNFDVKHAFKTSIEESSESFSEMYSRFICDEVLDRKKKQQYACPSTTTANRPTQKEIDESYLEGLLPNLTANKTTKRKYKKKKNKHKR